VSKSAAKTRSRRNRTIAITAAILAGFGAALIVPLAASAANVQVAGVVTGPTKTAMKGVTIELRKWSDDSTIQTTTSSASGIFSFAPVAQGSYALHFAATSATYAQYLGGSLTKEMSTSLDLASGATNVQTINVALSGASKITGKVKTATGVSLAKYTVRAFSLNNSNTWALAATALTSNSGTYTFSGLHPGAYRLEAIDLAHAAPSYAPLFSGGATDVESATSIGTFESKTATYNFALAKSGKVSGVVTGTTGNEKLAGVHVNVVSLVGTPGSFTSSLPLGYSSVTTNSKGGYSLAGLPAGYYTLEFVPPTTPAAPSTTVYGRTYLGNASEALDAPYIHVVSGASFPGRNIQLVGGATVHGKVTEFEDSNISIDNLQVTIDHASVDPNHLSADAQTVFTDASQGDNAFTFTGLGPGDYVLIIGSLTDGDTTRLREVVPLSNGFVNQGANQVERPSAKLADVGGLQPVPGSEPAISAITSYAVGEYLLVSNGTWNVPVDSADISYQWTRYGSYLPGETSQSYELTPGDTNNQVAVRVTACTFAYGCSTYSTAPSSTISPGTAVATGSPASINGTVAVGSVVTADIGDYTYNGFTTTYIWQRSADGASWISTGATGASYEIVADDLLYGPYLRAVYQGNAFGYNNLTGAIDAGAVSTGTFTMLTSPKVVTTSTAFSVTGGTWLPTYGIDTTSWIVYDGLGGSTITVGNSLSRAGLAGKRVTVSTSHSTNGFTTVNLTPVTVQLADAPAVSGSTAIIGIAQVGSTLQTPNVVWTPSPDSLSYVWQYKSGTSWKTIAGAGAYTYTPTAADRGRSIRVLTTTHSVDTKPSTVTSGASSPVVLGNQLANSGAAITSGTPATLQVATVDPGTFTPGATTLAYAWKQSADGGTTYTPISGATKANYTVSASYFGRTLAVDITATRPGYVSAKVTVAAGVVTHGSLASVTKPKVSRAGNIFTATAGTWSPTPESVSYAWYTFDDDNLNPTLVSSASTWDAASTGLHRHAILIVTAHATGFSDTASSTIQATKGDLIANATPTIIGGAVDAPMTISAMTWGQNSVALSYQWQYLSGSTWKNISGATHATYTPVGTTYLGKQVRAKIGATAPDYTAGTVSSTPTVVVLGATPIAGSGGLAPSILGPGVIGSAETANPGTWDTAGLTFSYQWLSSSDGVTYSALPGTAATKQTYVLPDTVLGHYLRVAITAKRAGHPDTVTGVDLVPTIDIGALSSTKAPTVSKKSDGSYVVSTGSWSAAPTSYSYLWQAVDPSTDLASPVSGPNGTTNRYKPVSGDGTALIRVSVIPSRPNYLSPVAVVVARKGVTLTATTAPFVFGPQTAGSSLTAIASDWNAASPTLAYKWMRDGKTIVGEVAGSYLQTATDVGHVVSVQITATKPGYASKSYTLKSPVTLSQTLPTATVKPKVTGSLYVDEVLTADPGTWNIPGLTFTYQWLQLGRPIAGATASTYLTRPADANNTVSVMVTATKKNYSFGTSTSPAYWVETAYVLNATQPAVIPSTATNGVALSPSTMPKWDLPMTVTFRWRLQVGGVGPFDDIIGATSSTFTPVGLSTGDVLQLVVTSARPGHYSNNEVSNSSVVN
jgi:hypothetical protein